MLFELAMKLFFENLSYLRAYFESRLDAAYYNASDSSAPELLSLMFLDNSLSPFWKQLFSVFASESE